MGNLTFLALAAFLAVWNIAVFALYGIDKYKARHNQWRIRESTLIICAFLMGGVGALLGMGIFRHKTKHLSFRLLVPLAVIVNIGVIVLGLYLLGLRPLFY